MSYFGSSVCAYTNIVICTHTITFKSGCRPLKTLRDGEKSHPVTEPCKAPRLEGAGIYLCYTIYVQAPWTLEVQDHGTNRLLKLLIENLRIRKP